MGADLYIEPKYSEFVKANYNEATYTALTKERDRLWEAEGKPRDENSYPGGPMASKAMQAAQDALMDYSDLRYGGKNPYYWRDSYNESNLLWAMGLSYWQSIIPGRKLPFINKSGKISVSSARALLQYVEATPIDYPEFEASSPEEVKTYFNEQKVRFCTFLRTAIDAGLQIHASV